MYIVLPSPSCVFLSTTYLIEAGGKETEKKEGNIILVTTVAHLEQQYKNVLCFQTLSI